jgi:hypothetical protein
MLPKGRPVLLTGDRFYGSAALIRWCRKQGWQYRLRLKDNLILHHAGGEITTGEAATAGMTSLLHAVLNETGVKTHIGILHEKGHKEPWIIAMSDTPSKGRVLDYGMRWAIEPLFSDFKSRGFGIAQTQLKHASRIERLILVLTVALYWAASTGMPPQPSKYTQKRRKKSDLLLQTRYPYPPQCRAYPRSYPKIMGLCPTCRVVRARSFLKISGPPNQTAVPTENSDVVFPAG